MKALFLQTLKRSRLQLEVLENSGVTLDLLRMDQLDPQISGNKWYKLKYHLQGGMQSGKRLFVSFGGAYSNHLHALAAAGQRFGFSTAAFIRGDFSDNLTPTLEDCVEWGMELNWLSRVEYRQRDEASIRHRVMSQYPECWLVPAGGGGPEGVRGVRECIETSLRCFAKQDGREYDLLVCPVGSGTTLAGMVMAAGDSQRCLGFSALKGAQSLDSEVEQLLSLCNAENHADWSLNHDFHFGGFARSNDALMDFIRRVKDQSGILLDPLYTAKTLFGICESVESGTIGAGQRILMLHTGGLQGWRGFNPPQGLTL